MFYIAILGGASVTESYRTWPKAVYHMLFNYKACVCLIFSLHVHKCGLKPIHSLPLDIKIKLLV